MPLHMSKTSNTCYINVLSVAYGMSQFKWVFNLEITKKLVEESTVLSFIVYFTQVKALVFSLKHIRKATNGGKFSKDISVLGLYQYFQYFLLFFLILTHVHY